MGAWLESRSSQISDLKSQINEGWGLGLWSWLLALVAFSRLRRLFYSEI